MATLEPLKGMIIRDFRYFLKHVYNIANKKKLKTRGSLYIKCLGSVTRNLKPSEIGKQKDYCADREVSQLSKKAS